MVGRTDRRAARAARPSVANGTIAPGDRVAIIGRSGSGKSVLLRRLVTPYRRALFLDPKRRNAFDGWAIGDGRRYVERAWPREFARIIARPGLLEPERDWMDALCRRAYYAGSSAVAVDELAGIATESRPLPFLDELLRRGRDPGPQGPITTLVATQRPRRIPLTVISEAEHVFLFDLNLPDDRAFVREVVGTYERPRIKHGFWYWTPDLDAAVECQPIAL